MLKLSDESYSQVLFETGYELAFRQSRPETQFAQAKTECPLFWDWYTNQFAIIDEKFCRSYRYGGDDPQMITLLRNFWLEEHMPESIEAFPGKEVYAQAQRILKKA